MKSKSLFDQSASNFSEMRKVVLLPGHGIGPEISESVKKIFNVLKIPVEWEEHQTLDKPKDESGDLIDAHTLA